MEDHRRRKRQCVDSLQELAVAQIGRELAGEPYELLDDITKDLLKNPAVREAFNEAVWAVQHEMPCQVISEGEISRSYAKLEFDLTQASAIVDEWLHTAAPTHAVPLRRPGELDMQWLFNRLGNSEDVMLWIISWEDGYPTQPPELGVERPNYVAEQTFKRFEDGDFEVREEDEELVGRTFQLGERTVQGPSRLMRADFVRHLREHWPETAASVLDYLKRMHVERTTYGSRAVVWKEADEGGTGRECSLPEKLRMVRTLGLIRY